MNYKSRFYRSQSSERNVVFNVKLDTTDLHIAAERNLYNEAYLKVHELRVEIENHIKERDEFLYSLKPLNYDGNLHPIIVDMYEAGMLAGVGPMAAVAGAIAEYTGKELLKFSREVIVENGGDTWMRLLSPAIAGIYTHNLYFKDKLWLWISPEETPCSLCTSSGTLGHSLSFGKADVVTVIAENGALADAVATGACNIVQDEHSMEHAIDYAMSIEGVMGCVIVYRDVLAAKGSVEFCSPFDE